MADTDLNIAIRARDDFSKQLQKSLVTIKKLEAELKAASRSTSPEAAQDIARLEAKLKDAQDSAKRLSSIVNGLDSDIDDLGRSASTAAGKVDKLDRSTRSGTMSMDSLKGAWAKGSIAAAGVAAAVVGLGVAIQKTAQVTWAAANAAAEYEKKVRRTDVVFGKYAKSVRKWADTSNETWGASVEDVAGYAAAIGDILKPLGFTTKAATRLAMGVGDLVPALAEWNTKGMDAAAVTDALTAALTGEREQLKSLGIVISEEDVKAKVESMRATGKLTGLTEKQAEAAATLKLATEGSADALRSYKNNAGSAGRAIAALRAGVADLRDAGLDILAETIRRLAQAMSQTGDSPVPGGLRWLRNNREDVISALMGIAGATLDLISVTLRLAQATTWAYGVVAIKVAAMIKAIEYVIPGVQTEMVRFADSLAEGGMSALKAADGMGTAAEAADRMSDAAWAGQDAMAAQAQRTKAVTQSTREFKAAIDALPKSKRIDVYLGIKATVSGAGSLASQLEDGLAGILGDTDAPKAMGAALPLQAVNDAYSAGLGAHRITSGQRSFALGSAQSDHARGRAMDVQGPRLGAYAQRVRAAGGYAAIHGSGAGRHLHVVPQRRPQVRASAPATIVQQQTMSPGDTYHVNVSVQQASSGVDVQAAVARGLRQAARERAERK